MSLTPGPDFTEGSSQNLDGDFSSAPIENSMPGETFQTENQQPTGNSFAPSWAWVAVLVVVIAVFSASIWAISHRDAADTTSGGSSAAPKIAPEQDFPSSPTSVWDEKPAAVTNFVCPDVENYQPGHFDASRLHGGNLSIASINDPDWILGDFQPSWLYNQASQHNKNSLGWLDSIAVGAVSVTDGFESPQLAAELSLTCLLKTRFDQNIPNLTSGNQTGVIAKTQIIESAGGFLDSHKTHWIRAKVWFNTRLDSFAGRLPELAVVDVVAIDTVSGESISVFLSAVSVSDPLLANPDITDANVLAGDKNVNLADSIRRSIRVEG